ncbi:hypothetical protein E2C01_102673 [Portunus trituberculatus]|uniref:Uncharacterized protein n=1 Tax=Portunus trituberculatus TaxID=210409 RepID=A0A5B7K8V0_PORTR|nr:hypothetical protein [Portunus trituberculatus]
MGRGTVTSPGSCHHDDHSHSLPQVTFLIPNPLLLNESLYYSPPNLPSPLGLPPPQHAR